MIFFKNKF